jgi:hypothetical protein
VHVGQHTQRGITHLAPSARGTRDGLKHYLGPFEAYASAPADTPFRESQDRLPYQNFYYEQEDILFAPPRSKDSPGRYTGLTP